MQRTAGVPERDGSLVCLLGMGGSLTASHTALMGAACCAETWALGLTVLGLEGAGLQYCSVAVQQVGGCRNPRQESSYILACAQLQTSDAYMRCSTD